MLENMQTEVFCVLIPQIVNTVERGHATGRASRAPVPCVVAPAAPTQAPGLQLHWAGSGSLS
jgi:hypothetical protein